MMQEAAVEEPPAPPPFDSVKFAESLPGITGPLGFFDPLGFCTSGEDKVSEAKIRFYREVELKHARVAMLAAADVLAGRRWRDRHRRGLLGLHLPEPRQLRQ